jgi:hypothetical protein
MFMPDFYVLEYAHWVEDPRPLPGLVRVQDWTLHLLSAATCCRPGALVVSGSAKGTNKALWFEHVEFLKIRHPEDPNHTVLAAKVNLVHIKDSGGLGRRYVPHGVTLRSLPIRRPGRPPSSDATAEIGRSSFSTRSRRWLSVSSTHSLPWPWPTTHSDDRSSRCRKSSA